jgi:hypothetical protein
MVNNRYDAVMATFSVGDTVHWTSQAGGVTTTKQGVIAAIIPAKAKVRTLVRDLAPYGASLERLGNGPLSCREEVSYVIRVRTSTYYWPLVSLLRIGPAPKVPTTGMPIDQVIRHLRDLDTPFHTKGKRRIAIRQAIAILSDIQKSAS